MTTKKLWLLSIILIFLSLAVLGIATVWAQGGLTDELHLTGGAVATATPSPTPTPTSTLNDYVAFWNLDEASGIRYDQGTGCGGGGCDLTDNNTVGQAAGVSAQTGYSAQFVAVNSEYLSHIDAASLSTGNIDFTLTAWCYLDSIPVANQYIISKGFNEYTLLRRDNNRFQFIVDGTTYLTAASFGALSTNTWYFVVAWRDASTGRIYIQINNGVVDSVISGAPTDTANQFTIGAFATGIVFWDGRIDAAGFWKRVLTPAERTWLYNAGQGRQYPF